MKKELKEFIKKNKLSDDDILKLLQSKPEDHGEESDVKDEPDESESQTDSKESDDPAEKGAAGTAEPPKNEELAKLVADLVAKALEEKSTKPKPKADDKKKAAPKPQAPKIIPNQWMIRDS